MDVIKLFILLLSLILTVNEVNCACKLTLNKDFGAPHPVILQNGEFLAPTRNGFAAVRRSEYLTVACPGSRRYVVLGNITTDLDMLDVKCVVNSTFVVGSWRGDFSQIRCNNHPWYDVVETTEECHGRNKIVRVGYVISEVFHKLYEVCFNRDTMSAIYSTHTLYPTSTYVQYGGPRPSFTEGDFYDGLRVNNLYKTKKQKQRFVELLGKDMDNRYLTQKQFLTRGHLAARADFSLTFGQRASFHYVNVAPQWMRGNAGDWAALEDALRRRIKTYGSPVQVYTGTDGVLTLRDENGRNTDIYLYSDENNNNIMPVPLYFYKLVYDPVQKTAAAFVSINSPYYTEHEIEKLVFCQEDCKEQFPWLSWRANDDTTSFCCNYDEFIEKIKTLPELDVRGIF